MKVISLYKSIIESLKKLGKNACLNAMFDECRGIYLTLVDWPIQHECLICLDKEVLLTFSHISFISNIYIYNVEICMQLFGSIFTLYFTSNFHVGPLYLEHFQQIYTTDATYIHILHFNYMYVDWLFNNIFATPDIIGLDICTYWQYKIFSLFQNIKTFEFSSFVPKI